MFDIYLIKKHVFQSKLTLLAGTTRAKTPTRVPTVLSNDEAMAIIDELKPPYHLMFSILYGCGLKKAELLRLRIKDIDFSGNSIYVFRGKEAKDRMTLLPSTLIDPLKAQIAKVEHIHQKNLAEGQGKTSLPAGLARKYPYAITELKWQYIFPSVVRCQQTAIFVVFIYIGQL
jgi:integrase